MGEISICLYMFLFYQNILPWFSLIISNLAGTLIFPWSFWWNLTPFPAKKVGILQIFIFEWWNLKIFPVIHQYQGGFSGEIWWNLKMFSQVIQVALILGQVRRGLPRSLCCLSLPMSRKKHVAWFLEATKKHWYGYVVIYIYIHVSILYLSNALNIQQK